MIIVLQFSLGFDLKIIGLLRMFFPFVDLLIHCLAFVFLVVVIQSTVGSIIPVFMNWLNVVYDIILLKIPLGANLISSKTSWCTLWKNQKR